MKILNLLFQYIWMLLKQEIMHIKYISEPLNLNNTDYINILLDSFKNEVDILLKNLSKKFKEILILKH